MNTQQIQKMYAALATIAKDYQTPEQLRKESKGDWGLDYEEALGMAYENMQNTARQAIKGIRTKSLTKNSVQ